MRLPLHNRYLGWTPYAWLIYLVFFLLAPVPAGAPWQVMTARAVTILLFLPLYVAGYRLHGARKLWPVAGMCLLGTVHAPFNAGASTMFIYAGSFIGQIDPPSKAARWLAVLVALIALESVIFHLRIEFWLVASVFAVITGSVNIHFAQQRRANAKLYLAHAEIERLAQTAERERIARDLHDLLGHTLSLIILKSELAGKLLDRDPARAAQEIREVERVGRDALAQVREAVRGYKAPSLKDELRNADEAFATAGIELTAAVPDVTLNPAQTTALVLALREAVTNVVRHANARRCRITLTSEADACRLEIIDNGSGGSAPDGAGLNGMRERVAMLGGHVERISHQGTTIRVTLPLKPAPAAAGEVA